MVRGRPNNPDELSRDPRQIRARIRRKNSKMDQDLQMLYEEQDYKPVDQWDLEELAAGKPRRSDGKWRRGPAPKWITGKVNAEVQRRLIDLGQQTLAQQLGPAIKLMTDLMGSTDRDAFDRPLVSAEVKLRAAQFIIDHVLGKPKQKIDLGVDESFRSFLADALVNPDGEEAHPIIEGTATYEGEDDDDGE